MRILLKFVIDCDVDAAWRALHSPRAVAELYGPLLHVQPLVQTEFPSSWEPGADAGVQLSLAGLVPMGRQLISVSDREVTDEHGAVWIFRDSGMPMDQSPPLFSGDKRVIFPKGWDRVARLMVRQQQPLPMTILAIVPQITTMDG